MKASITIPFTVGEDFIRALRRENTKEELLDFIIGIDAQISEVDFTEALLRRLVKSLRADLTTGEILNIVESELR